MSPPFYPVEQTFVLTATAPSVQPAAGRLQAQTEYSAEQIGAIARPT